MARFVIMDLKLFLCRLFFEEHFKCECILISSLNEEQLCRKQVA